MSKERVLGGWRLAYHRAIVAAGAEVIERAVDLTGRTARLNAVASKLRSKRSDQAVGIS